MKYLIIGNSAAAIGAVEGIRSVDTDGEITIVSNEPHHTYSRPLISYLLQGKTDKERMKYRDAGFYENNRCVTRFGRTVTKIYADTKAGKKVLLDNGDELFYDKLLVATGSRAFVPPFGGLDSLDPNQVHTFITLADAERLNAQLDETKKVLVVGAGLIGLKCAEGIYDRVASVTVVDLAPRILSSILNDEGAEIVQKHIEKKGVEFRLSRGVKRFEKGIAILDEAGKEVVPFDIVVIAVGVRPNVELMRDIAETEKGIIVDETSRTSHADIYAAGDCTETNDVSSGVRRIMALLPNAYMQGETAGINMAGGVKTFDKAIPMNAIGFWGLHVITAGSVGGNSVYSEKTEKSYKQLFHDDKRIYGYIMIGDVMKAGIYTSLIREQTPLDTLDFELICKSPGLMAFNREDRAAKLGGSKAI